MRLLMANCGVAARDCSSEPDSRHVTTVSLPYDNGI